MERFQVKVSKRFFFGVEEQSCHGHSREFHSSHGAFRSNEQMLVRSPALMELELKRTFIEHRIAYANLYFDLRNGTWAKNRH